jgi:hypothetical protein
MSRLFFGVCQSQKRGSSRTQVYAMAWLKSDADRHPKLQDSGGFFAASLFIVIL